ncbi:hypothetical protein MTR_6g052700 [Medicago truncatula]|uniref:Uncharacterized protein n=1 Tax=Medicago truncatula TaxID=3880 RepID=G7KLI4_MEDTR|nr:hypothetical protein MTR_6g052700 [Medicago truncatula]
MEYHDNHTRTWYGCVPDTGTSPFYKYPYFRRRKVIEQIKEKLLLSDQDLHTSKLEQDEWLMMISMKNFKI